MWLVVVMAVFCLFMFAGCVVRVVCAGCYVLYLGLFVGLEC